MTTPSSSSDKGNHPSTATRGGASSQPTPANNVGGGSGWGDSGLLSGGGAPDTGPRAATYHGHSETAQSGNFSSLEQQKKVGEESYKPENVDVPKPEDAPAFAEKKPGAGGFIAQSLDKFQRAGG